MYSVVLMMAMTGAPATPAFGGRRGCDGCWGGSACAGACHGRRDDCCGRRGLLGRRGCNDCGGCSGDCHGRRRSKGCCGSYVACSGGCAGVGCVGGAGCATTVIETKKEEKKATGKEEASIAAPATIVVSLPAEAKLKIDNHLTTSTSATRVFTSPALELGKAYTYTLTATITREGREVSASQDVTVQAGQETRVTLNFPVATVASR